MPHMAAHLAGSLKHSGKREVQVIDCFGLQPNHRQIVGEFMLMGETEDQVVKQLSPNAKICFIYCRTIAEFVAVERLIDNISSSRPDLKIVLLKMFRLSLLIHLKMLRVNLLEGEQLIILESLKIAL